MARQLAAGIAGLCLALWLVPAESAPAPKSAGRVAVDAHRSLGAPKGFKNLTLIPIYDSAARSTTPYLTLDEGLKTKRVQVKEVAGGGEVNTLLVTNDSDQSLYILG